jgi:hypothetical protein
LFCIHPLPLVVEAQRAALPGYATHKPTPQRGSCGHKAVGGKPECYLYTHTKAWALRRRIRRNGDEKREREREEIERGKFYHPLV